MYMTNISFATYVLVLREGGYIGLFITLVPKVLLWRFYLFAYQLWGLLLILIDWCIKLSVQNFQQIIVIYRRDNCVYHHWG